MQSSVLRTALEAGLQVILGRQCCVPPWAIRRPWRSPEGLSYQPERYICEHRGRISFVMFANCLIDPDSSLPPKYPVPSLTVDHQVTSWNVRTSSSPTRLSASSWLHRTAVEHHCKGSSHRQEVQFNLLWLQANQSRKHSLSL
jgi:hypothetical protein